METEKFIVAIDLGSTKITGALARKTPEGKIDILASETVEAKFIRHGEIKNTSETAEQIKDIVKKLNEHEILRENELEINTVYAALGGQSILSMPYSIERLLGKEDVISENLARGMYAENYHLKLGAENEIFNVFEQEYLVDDELECNPVGMNCSNLQCFSIWEECIECHCIISPWELIPRRTFTYNIWDT